MAEERGAVRRSERYPASPGGEIGRIQAEWKEKEIRCGNLREHCAEIESEAGDAEKELAGRCRALQIAEEQMRLAADSLGKQTAGNLNEQASQIFAAVTEGKYQRLDIGEKTSDICLGRHPAHSGRTSEQGNSGTDLFFSPDGCRGYYAGRADACNSGRYICFFTMRKD